jgi:xanthine dehydrogenase accessory factor
MTIAVERAAVQAHEAPGECPEPAKPLIEPVENVLPCLLDWRRQGLRTALATLVAIDGSFPRALGAQMAIAEDGAAAGYLSGGCLERALIAEAQNAIKERANRMVRYGKGSKYFDIVLPCGSAVEIHIDVNLPTALAAKIQSELAARRPALLKTDLSSGEAVICDQPAAEPLKTARQNHGFARAYWPGLRLVIAGAGPAVTLLARLARTADMTVEILTPDAGLMEEAARRGFAARLLTLGRSSPPAPTLDAWTAGVFLFHDHAWELPLLPIFLKSDCFYLGAVGGSRTRETRKKALAESGFDQAAIAMLRTPAGTISHARKPAELAVSILSEIVAADRDRRVA